MQKSGLIFSSILRSASLAQNDEQRPKLCRSAGNFKPTARSLSRLTTPLGRRGKRSIRTRIFGCPAGMAPASCGSPGTVYLNGTPFIQNGEQFVGAGSTVTVQANPNPGFFLPVGSLRLSNSQAFVLSLPVNEPVTLFPIFQRARQVSMSIATSGVGLQVLLDRTPVPLFFVSPGQINVQLPSNLVDGSHTLTVHLEGKPEASEKSPWRATHRVCSRAAMGIAQSP